jgi:Arc/MetJ family transcription regulator
MTETWDDLNERVKADWKDDTTLFERVYEIIEQTHERKSAAEIAERALVSEPTARRFRTRRSCSAQSNGSVVPSHSVRLQYCLVEGP